MRGFGLLTVVALCLLTSGTAGAETPVPMRDHHQMVALFVIDHNGANPRSDAQLVPYSRAFEKVLEGCRIGVDGLTNKTLDLSEQATYNGTRIITSLEMLRAIARRIDWKGSRSCGYIYNSAEGHLEGGES
jgi:hypothetical protein